MRAVILASSLVAVASAQAFNATSPVLAQQLPSCAIPGLGDYGAQSVGCCQSALARTVTGFLLNPNFPAQMKAGVTACAGTLIGGCRNDNTTYGNYLAKNETMDNALYMICHGTTADDSCGDSLVAGLIANNNATTNMNALLKMQVDANSDGVYDFCVGYTTTTTTTTTIGLSTVMPSCAFPGLVNFGSQSLGCCQSGLARLITNTLMNPAIPAQMKAGALAGAGGACPYANIGGCLSTNGTYDALMATPTALENALYLICAHNSGSCSTSLITGLNANNGGGANAAAIAGLDANSDGSYDLCASYTTTTTTTPGPNTPVPCANPMVNYGTLPLACCAAAQSRFIGNVLASPSYSAGQKALVTTCAAAPIGGCESTGTYAGRMPTSAALDNSLHLICSNSGTCGTAVIAGIGANAAVTNMNAMVKAQLDANSDGTYDLCASWTATTTTTQAPQTHTASSNSQTVVSGRMGLTMNLSAGTTAASLNSNTAFKTSLKAALAASLAGVSASDIMISNITLSNRRRLAEARELAITGATVDFAYSILVADATVAQQAVTATQAATFKNTLKNQTNTAIAANMSGADAAAFQVSAVATVPAPAATGAYSTTTGNSSGANTLGVAAALVASAVAAMFV